MTFYSTGIITSNNNLTTSGYEGYQYLLVDATSGSLTITLSSTMQSNGQTFQFQRIDGNLLAVVTLAAPSGTTINGTLLTSATIPTKSYAQVIFWNNVWYLYKAASL